MEKRYYKGFKTVVGEKKIAPILHFEPLGLAFQVREGGVVRWNCGRKAPPSHISSEGGGRECGGE
jgi:hypothetical protein